MRTLVLNAGYEPLGVISDRRALVLVLNGKATALATDAAHPVCARTGCWDRPSVILLTRYIRIQNRRAVPVTRRGVLRRDAHTCAYCAGHASTIDHVLPRSRGGANTWENLVACCLTCNNRKGDKTPTEMGWQLRISPRSPNGVAWTVNGVDRPLPEWQEFLRVA